MHRVRAILTGTVLLLAVAACTGEREPSRSSGTPASPMTSETPASRPTPSATATPRPTNPVSVPALFDRPYDGRGLRLGPVLARTDAYTSYTVTYRSGPLRISGKLDVPRDADRTRRWCWRTGTSIPRST